jgi:hypothetical protein
MSCFAAVLVVSVVARGGDGQTAVTRASQPKQSQSQAMHAELVAQMIGWVPDPRVADQVNPFRAKVVALGEQAVPALLARLADAAPNSEVVGALGEIGSSRAFPALLGKYLLTPSDTIAVAIGSTLGKAELVYLRDGNPLEPDALTHLLGVVMGTPGRPVTDKSLNALWQAAFDDLAAVRNRCLTRSRPTPG